MDYHAIKYLHITCAALSGIFFILRGFWMLRDSAMLHQRWVRISPHLVDTTLLASAIIMMIWSGQYPFVQHWLTAKVLALLAYIVLGTFALKRGRTKAIRVRALIASLAVFAYIVSVAITKQPFVFT